MNQSNPIRHLPPSDHGERILEAYYKKGRALLFLWHGPQTKNKT